MISRGKGKREDPFFGPMPVKSDSPELVPKDKVPTEALRQGYRTAIAHTNLLSDSEEEKKNYLPTLQEEDSSQHELLVLNAVLQSPHLPSKHQLNAARQSTKIV